MSVAVTASPPEARSLPYASRVRTMNIESSPVKAFEMPGPVAKELAGSVAPASAVTVNGLPSI